MTVEKSCIIIKAAVCCVKFSRMMMVSPLFENFGKKVLRVKCRKMNEKEKRWSHEIDL